MFLSPKTASHKSSIQRRVCASTGLDCTNCKPTMPMPQWLVGEEASHAHLGVDADLMVRGPGPSSAWECISYGMAGPHAILYGTPQCTPRHPVSLTINHQIQLPPGLGPLWLANNLVGVGHLSRRPPHWGVGIYNGIWHAYMFAREVLYNLHGGFHL